MSRNINKIIWPWAVLGIILISLLGVYIKNFYKFPWSEAPSDWGAIGDYFGGLLNPIVSALALYFLIKTYLSQKEELVETREVLRKTGESNEVVASAQKILVETQYLTSLINSEYQRVEYLYKELERCTEAIVNVRNSIDRHGKELNSDEAAKQYRVSLIRDIAVITNRIDMLDRRLSEINISLPV
ncbi:hypothetical protein TVA88_04000 [Aeromonas hydrophila]|uniref:hypothetical protein n=1 Tax=Aeromonas hydrophila TaxID=644 RepID=UPI00311E863C